MHVWDYYDFWPTPNSYSELSIPLPTHVRQASGWATQNRVHSWKLNWGRSTPNPHQEHTAPLLARVACTWAGPIKLGALLTTKPGFLADLCVLARVKDVGRFATSIGIKVGQCQCMQGCWVWLIVELDGKLTSFKLICEVSSFDHFIFACYRSLQLMKRNNSIHCLV